MDGYKPKVTLKERMEEACRKGEVTAEFQKALNAATPGNIHEAFHQIVRTLSGRHETANNSPYAYDKELAREGIDKTQPVFDYFIQSGKIDVAAPNVADALWIAAARGANPVIEAILDLGVDVNAKHGVLEDCALQVAAWGGQVETVRLLLARRANVHQVDDSGKTALFKAVEHKGEAGVKVAEMLIEAGADVNQRETSFGGRPPFGGDTPLFDAAEANNIPAMELLLKHGAKLDAQNGKGDTVLHACADDVGVEAETVKWLLRHGANPELENDWGETPQQIVEKRQRRAAEQSAGKRSSRSDALNEYDLSDKEKIALFSAGTGARKASSFIDERRREVRAELVPSRAEELSFAERANAERRKQNETQLF